MRTEHRGRGYQRHGYEARDGFTHNDFLGKDVDDRERIFGCASLRWMPIDSLDVQVIFDKDRYEMGGPVYARLDTMWDDPYHVGFNKDNYVIQVPRFNNNGAVQYRRPLTAGLDIVGRVDVQGIGERYWDDANTEKADPFTLVNLRLGVEKKAVGVYFWVRNLFDTEYERVAFDCNGMWATPGDPLTLSFTVSTEL